MAAAVRDQVQAAIDDQQFQQIAAVLDKAELESLNPEVLQDWPHALHLLGHVYTGNIADARFLWKRVPEECKTEPEVEAVWRLIQAFWCHHYQTIWQMLQGYQWSEQVRPIIDALAIKTREDTLGLLGRAYSIVASEQAAMLLGMSVQDAVPLCLSYGWQLDEADFLKVVQRKRGGGVRNGSANLRQLTEYLMHLERAQG